MNLSFTTLLVTMHPCCRWAALLVALVAAHSPVQAAPPITAAAFAPDGRQVLLGSQRGIDIRSWPELKPIQTIDTELSHIHDLAFSPDGQWLLAAGGAPAEAGSVELRSWPDHTLARRVTHHQDLVYRAAWSPDGAGFATASADGLCHVVARDSGEVLATYRGHSKAVLAIAYLPDGKSIVSAGLDQTLRLWDTASGQHQRTLDNHVGTVNDVAIRPVASRDSPPIVASIGEDRTVRLWQPTIGRLMRFARLPSPPRALAWAPDGQRLNIGCSDGQVRAVDWETAEVVLEKRALSGRIHAIAVNRHSSRILAAGEGEPVSVEF